MHKGLSSFAALFVWTALSGSAHAHIKLLKPESWLNEDAQGAPQKGGPCGPGGFDDVQPMPLSMKVTTAKAGDTLMVEFEETVHHPGWFRIALAPDPSEFEEIKFPNANDCTYDMSTVPTEPHGNVLADGLGMDTAIAGSSRKFMEQVKLPDAACEKCTLQVIQVMADALHAPPGCVYYHCAELTILPKDGAAAGGGGAGASGTAGAAAGAWASASAGKSGSAGMGVPAGQGGKGGTVGAVGGASTGSGAAGVLSGSAGGPGPLTPTDSGASAASGGCAVASTGAHPNNLSGALCLGLGALAFARRKRLG
jgi:hypothetical protein